jgi:Endonuclease/Exonuclease/phosphatase family
MGGKMLIRKCIAGVAVIALALAVLPGPAIANHDKKRRHKEVRFATFNASLNRNSEGQLIQDLSTPNNAQARTVAEIIQRNRPDVVLINEFDFDSGHVALRLFQDNYLSVSQNGAKAIDYRYAYTAPSNTGIPSGFDLNNDGNVGGPDDAFGFGFFPGQFGMAPYSRYRIDFDEIRTFQKFLWADLPGASLPDDPNTPASNDWFSDEELEVVRLSSKSHWDVPIEIGKRTVHVLAAHPTPPVFDGPEDRNGLRNFDEIGFWAEYVSNRRSKDIYDDEGKRGGLRPGAPFVIMGDYNSDPNDGDSVPGAIQQLLDLSRVRTNLTPSSEGGPEQAELQGGINDSHVSDPAFDTADFADTAPGNLRVDYVLPSRPLKLEDAAVFWPLQSDPLFRLVGVFPFPSSDHRLVWADVGVPGARK